MKPRPLLVQLSVAVLVAVLVIGSPPVSSTATTGDRVVEKSSKRANKCGPAFRMVAAQRTAVGVVRYFQSRRKAGKPRVCAVYLKTNDFFKDARMGLELTAGNSEVEAYSTGRQVGPLTLPTGKRRGQYCTWTVGYNWDRIGEGDWRYDIRLC